jgi:hypothetical protein
MSQTILTFITKIDPGKRADLEKILTDIQANLDTNAYVPFASISLVHFSSFVILDDDAYGPYLVYENNFDGELDPYLDELMQVAGNGLHQIYSCCLNYGGGAFEPGRLHAYLRAHTQRPNAFHIGNPGRPAKRINQEKLLREQIQGRLDTVAGGSTAAVCRDSIQQFVKDDASLGWATAEPGPRQTSWERTKPWINIGLVVVLAILFLPVLIPVAIIWLIILRYHEMRDRGADPPNVAHIRELTGREDQIVQNQLASLTIVRPGAFRRLTLWVVLFAVNLLARAIANKGELSGIPSIHFAHWSMIDNGRRLLFLSNFDGSWMGYLDDFIDKAATGLTGVWTNTLGFPKTKFLVFEGAKNEADFKAFARNTQVPTLVWYSAYPELTVQSVDHDSLIREDLFKPMDDNSVKNYLQLF